MSNEVTNISNVSAKDGAKLVRSKFKEGLKSTSSCHSGRDWPTLFFRKKVCKNRNKVELSEAKLVTVPYRHKGFPFLLSPIRYCAAGIRVCVGGCGVDATLVTLSGIERKCLHLILFCYPQALNGLGYCSVKKTEKVRREWI